APRPAANFFITLVISRSTRHLRLLLWQNTTPRGSPIEIPGSYRRVQTILSSEPQERHLALHAAFLRWRQGGHAASRCAGAPQFRPISGEMSPRGGARPIDAAQHPSGQAGAAIDCPDS